jgi:hypothetical protein
MTKDDLQNLLVESESDHIDWKVKPPAGLELPAKEIEHQEARGELLKDIQALANARSQSIRYLVWGVADNVRPRRIKPFRNDKNFDDAKFQDWVKNAMEPTLRFNYIEIDWETDGIIGVFKIYPESGQTYVAKSDVGGVLHKGQVWYRQSSQNNVATLEQLKKFFNDSGIQLNTGFINQFGAFCNSLEVQRKGADELNLQGFYQRLSPKVVKVIDKFEQLKKATLQKTKMTAEEPSSKEMRESNLGLNNLNYKSMGEVGQSIKELLKFRQEVRLSQNQIGLVTEFLDKIGITYTPANFEFNGLSYGLSLPSPLSGGQIQQIIGDEKERERYYLFWEIVEAIEEAEHDINEEARVWAYTPIKLAVQNIGRKSAHKLEIEISPTGSAPRLHFYNTVPTKKPKSTSDIRAGLMIDSFAHYEAQLLQKFHKEIDHLPPGGRKEVGQVAIRPSREGCFQFGVTIKGQDIPEPLNFLLEIEVKAP